MGSWQRHERSAMKPIRWTSHAERKAAEREVPRAEVELTVRRPESVLPGQARRMIHSRRYTDAVLQTPMLLRVVIEETPSELIVVTLYKTSKFGKYEPGSRP